MKAQVQIHYYLYRIRKKINLQTFKTRVEPADIFFLRLAHRLSLLRDFCMQLNSDTTLHSCSGLKHQDSRCFIIFTGTV